MTEVLVMRESRCCIAVASDCAVRCSFSCCSFHTMDEKEVHTSLVNIAYSGASTRNNIY